MSEIIVSKNVKHRTQLLAYANMQKNGWKMVLAELVMKHRTKVVNELIEAAWEMHKAQEKLHQRGKCRIDWLSKAASEECICWMQGQWKVCALEVLHVNDIPPQQFRDSVKVLLEKGRSKYRNVMLTGPANCGKTFLLNPLNKIYNTFTNPATFNFAWCNVRVLWYPRQMNV